MQPDSGAVAETIRADHKNADADSKNADADSAGSNDSVANNAEMLEKIPGSGLNARRVHLPRFDVDIGPMEHLREERERLGALQWQHFTAERLSSTCGAVLHGVDITGALSEDQVTEIREALLAYKVIFFRDQPFTAEQHISFARLFGDLEVHPFLPGNEAHPELVRFEKGAETGGYENGWHHDVSWRETPSMGAVLRAIEVPSAGGDTLFCDMSAAYEELDEAMKERLDGLIAVHDFMHAFGRGVPEDKLAEAREQYPLVEHPVVRTHPETGRKLIYVNAYFTSHIKDMDEAESIELIRFLTKRAQYPEYQCRFHWQPHSVAFWDNRIVQHYATSDYWPDVRIMERASIIGDRPV